MRTGQLKATFALMLAVGALMFLAAPSIKTAIAADDGPSLVTPPQPAPADEAAPDSGVMPAGAEVLTRGPVHEAFATPIDSNPQPGPVLKKRPPDPIQEIPPDQRPEGDSVVWINGYWGWDDDKSDYIWISGVYRSAPPYQTWVPGYWNEVPGGYQWTSGFWTANSQEQVPYITEAPPQSLENGPQGPQPSDDHFWVPGNWVYRTSNYAWQPGYWSVARPDWIWIPAHYSWTPAGYVFIPGYWDYTLANRGCLFAPVYYPQPIYAQPAFVYTPSVLINVGAFDDCLFVRPAYCHYYFGDYFAPTYASVGFYPWFSLSIGGGRRYDPLFTYYRWNHIHDRDWVAQRREHFERLQRNELERPPRTFAQQQQLLKDKSPPAGVRRTDLALASTLNQAAKNPTDNSLRLQRVSQIDRQELANKGRELQQASVDRGQIEKQNASLANAGNRNRFATGGPPAGTGAIAGPGATGKSPVQTLKLPTAAASNIKLSGTQSDSGGNPPAGTTGPAAGRAGIGRFPTSNLAGQQSANGQSGADQSNTGSAGRKFDSRIGQGNVNTGNLGNSQNTGPNNSQSLPRNTRSSTLSGGQNALGFGSGAAGTGSAAGVTPPNIRFQQPSNFQSGNAAGNFVNPNAGNPQQNIRLQPQNLPNGGSQIQGGGNRGGGPPPKKDDDNARRSGRTSSRSPPSTIMNLDPTRSPSLNLRSSLDARRDTNRGPNLSADPDPTGGDRDPIGLDKIQPKLDPLADDPETTKPRRTTAKLPADVASPLDPTQPTRAPLRQSGIPSTTPQGLGGLNQPANRNENLSGNRFLSGNPGAANSSVAGGTSASPRGGVDLSALNPLPHAPKTAGLSRYDYQNMLDRGRSLSMGSAATNNFSGDNAPNPRLTKDPMTAISGRPTASSPTMYGPAGLSSSPSGLSGLSGLSSSSDSSQPRGSGSYISPSTLPQLPRWQSSGLNNRTSTGSFGSGSRSYDPSNSAARTYDPRNP